MSALQFTYTQGGALPAAQSITVECVDCETRSIVSGPIQATLKKNAAWLLMDKTSGSTPLTVNVSVNPSGLIPGNYNATIGVATTSEVICNPDDTKSVNLIVAASLPPVARNPIIVKETITLQLKTPTVSPKPKPGKGRK